MGAQLLERNVAYRLKAGTRLEFERGVFTFRFNCPTEASVI